MSRLKLKALMLGGLIAVIGMFLSNCFLAPPSPTVATLMFSDLVGPVGGQGEVKVSVVNMPGGGLSALVVGSESVPGAEDWLGLQYDPAQFQVTELRGINGFQILATHIDNLMGEVRFVAVKPTKGVVDGDVVLMVGNRLGGANFEFQVQKANLQLLDANGNSITVYNVAIGQAPPYYVKGGRG